jgi:polyphosphate glucokinase
MMTDGQAGLIFPRKVCYDTPRSTDTESNNMEFIEENCIMHVLGVDIGGSGIKGTPIDTTTGTLLKERHRIPTPQPAAPGAVTETVAQLVDYFHWDGPIGCGFPAVIKDGIVQTAANIAPAWIGMSARCLLERATGCPVWVANDADTAGLAEMRFGAGRGRSGVVLVVTIGTGIGTALFVDDHLVPNTELGHIEIHNRDAETYASDGVRKEEDLKWSEWAARLDEYLRMVERLLWPDLIIIGGGVSKKYEKFFPFLTVRSEIVPAHLRNEAGMIGAAMVARSTLAGEMGGSNGMEQSNGKRVSSPALPEEATGE